MVICIAFLFLTLDNPNFTDIWDYYFKGNEDKINIYIHPKYPENVTWKKQCIINKLKPTEWGFIINAYQSLFIEALKNKSNYKFITISESCVPIVPFKKLYQDLIINLNESLIKLLPITKYDLHMRLTTKIIDSIGRHNLIKHYARMCLSRSHVKKLLNSKFNLFSDIQVGDEFFLSSIMPINNFNNFAVTFDDWNYVDKQKKKIKNEIKQLYIYQENNKNINNTDKIFYKNKHLCF